MRRLMNSLLRTASADGFLTITIALLSLAAFGQAAGQFGRSPSPGPGQNLARNATFETGGETRGVPEHYELSGSARWITVGYRDEFTSAGVALEPFGEQKASGTVSQKIGGIDPAKGKWVRFTFRGLAEEGFLVEKDQLFIKLEFYARNGANFIDSAERLIYREVEKDRRELAVNGNYGRSGGAVWRTYEFEELLPFAEVDAVRVTVGFKNGVAKGSKRAAFFVDDFSLTQHPRSGRGLTDPADAQKPAAAKPAPVSEKLVPLGGRWYYEPAKGESVPTGVNGRLSGKLTVTEANADRLYYRDDRLVNPFAANMTAWLREGYLDRSGSLVKEDRFVPDSVSLEFDGGETVLVRAKNIPNHPTARFPDTYGTQGYNPSYIQERDFTYHLPLEPAPNPAAAAMIGGNANGALPMGAVGIAVNGVVFYNPFDAGMQDASSIMDRCCGHPSPDNRYHYHKYPICVNTPFVDKGEAHSPVVGFAFDGYPVYGPYETAGVMAKDLTANPLNAFNGHADGVRGWHYHCTPGKFPYLLGGYYGKVEVRNFPRRGPRGRM